MNVALHVQPDLQQLFVVSGASAFDRFYLELAQRQLREFEGRVAVTYFAGLSMADLLERVRNLPDRTAIYFLSMQEDGRGRRFNGPDSLEQVAAVANRPIYGWVDVGLGRGIIGGQLLSIEALATAVSNIALRILRGESPERIAVEEIDPHFVAFDSRALRRFQIDEARLPPGSAIEFREASVWEHYGNYILAAATLLVLQSALIGALVVQGVRRRRAELAVRESASALGQAYSENRDLAGRLIDAQEKERSRIARELHDDLSQQLAGVAIMASVLKRKIVSLLTPGSHREVEQSIAMMQERVVTAAKSVRTLSHQLHPGGLEHTGLVDALRRHCSEIEASHEIKVNFHQRGDRLEAIDADVALCLFRVTQESLSNAVRHARAGHILVELTATKESASLRIVDDGIGFSRGKHAGVGLGLRSIDERVRLSRGVVKVDSAIGRGTTLSVRIPYPSGKQATGSPSQLQ